MSASKVNGSVSPATQTAVAILQTGTSAIPAWAIAVSLIAGVIVFIVLFFLIMRHQRKHAPDEELGDMTPEQMMAFTKGEKVPGRQSRLFLPSHVNDREQWKIAEQIYRDQGLTMPDMQNSKKQSKRGKKSSGMPSPPPPAFHSAERTAAPPYEYNLRRN